VTSSPLLYRKITVRVTVRHLSAFGL